MPAITELILAFRRLRRWLKSGLPYVRRREYRKLERLLNAYADTLVHGLRPAADARVHTLKAGSATPGGQLCLFVSHASTPALKPHVLEHLHHLLDAGFEVMFIVNTDLDPHTIVVPPALLDRLAACHVRENVGFDFAAWAHAWQLGGRHTQLQRLLLVNDSIVGPLDREAFNTMVRRLRAATADLVGLTETHSPRHHVQSFFLAFGPRALQSAALARFLGGVQAFPTKDMVIDVYETRMTALLHEAGLSAQVLFPSPSDGLWGANDTGDRWAELIRRGFPYIKASVLARKHDTRDAQALVPQRFRAPPP